MDMLTVNFAPMFPWPVLGAVAGLALIIAAYGVVRGARGMLWRTIAIAALWLALANPVLVEEERTPINDVAAVVVDASASQKVAQRPAQTEAALAHVRARLASMKHLDVRVIRAGAPSERAGAPVDGTRIFDRLGRALANIPKKRMAGAILITDGQVHDAPADGAAPIFGGPVHVMLTGARGERDRKLTIEHAPSFALVGKRGDIQIRVVDDSAAGGGGGVARVKLNLDGKPGPTIMAPIGAAHTIPLKIEHAGANIIQIEVEPAPGELTLANNRAVVQINGVRERLRVLLVSGEPHPGERVWRNLLKADPSVDLVHFTILRPPEKQDATPVRELSLIAFPIRELFEVKLAEFDLIIFDRYRRRGVLPAIYLDNIVRYIENGGAVLEAAGPAFASTLSLFRTPLGGVLPGAPTGKVYERGLKARLTTTGGRHPVTADLVGADEARPRWGRWFRQVAVSARRGMALLNGVEDRPLLIVDRVGKGRVAQLLSDHIWLWARGYDGGGPHSELLRRLSHWLMKEPDLEENDLRAMVDGNSLMVIRRSVERDETPVEITSPSGAVRKVKLEEGVGGRAIATVPVSEVGVYRVGDGHRATLAAVGQLNPREFSDMRATADLLAPTMAATGGGVRWIADGMPTLRRVRAGRATAGSGWFGLVANRDYRVDSVREASLLPALAVLFLAFGALILAWRREGR